MNRQAGQAATEYLVIVVSLVAALLLPLGDQPSLAEQLARALLRHWSSLAFLIAAQ
jgi:hypothetical protein